jgi:hypothetical protein
VHVARQTVKSGDDQWATCCPGFFQSYGKSRAQQQRVRSSAGLHILVPGLDREPFANSKRFDLVPLRRESEAAAALFLSADPSIRLLLAR